MKAATIKEIKDELSYQSKAELLTLCLRMARFKKENKELLTYLLFESQNEDQYILSVKDHIDAQFSEMSSENSLYLIKKSLRKVLRSTNKFIRYTGSKTAGIQLLIYYCKKIKGSHIQIHKSVALTKLYQGQLKKIRKELLALHEDLQYDYVRELDLL